VILTGFLQAYERRKLERKLREKELAYRERLKIWENREQKKLREYETDKKKEIQRRKQVQKDKKKLKQFLEDYDDEKDDEDFYKGVNLTKRLKMREKEIELDNRDRQREKEELEELKQKLLLAKANQTTDEIEDELKKVSCKKMIFVFVFCPFGSI
jgi:RNA-binding protein 25